MRACAFLLFVIAASAQNALERQIATIAADANGKVAVACALPGSSIRCDFNAHAHPPMQSVFKAPLALTALHWIEQGKLELDQPIRFRVADRIPQAYSPLQDKYPEAEVDIPLRELLRLAVSLSDNAAADLILLQVGGPQGVHQYMHSLGIRGFQLQDNEAALHHEVAAQYRNWFEPASAVQFLRRLSDNSPITTEHTALLLGWMQDSPRGNVRIKGLLPAGTVVMHKPGTSAAACNDIGLITLPDGRNLAIAIFITDAQADEAKRDQVIARISRAVYDAAIQEPQSQSNDTVQAFMRTVAHDITQEGPAAWRRYFSDTPAFFMAVNGQLAFSSSAAVTAAIPDLVRTIKHIELQWGDDLRVDPLSPVLAVVGTSYHEIRVSEDNQRVDENGYFTATVERKEGRWQFRNLHWSAR
jgi:beta-lactamase class A